MQPALSAIEHLALLHSMAFVQPVVTRVSSVVTVYDLTFLLFPYLFRPLNRLYLQWGTRFSLRRARQVIAISERTRQDLIRIYGLDPARVIVAPCGVDPAYCPSPADPAESEALKARYHLPERFILYLGTLEPRKNLPHLIRAYALARQSAALPKLVLAGGRGWYDEPIDRAIAESGVQEEIVVTGYFPGPDLPALYRAAEAFVYPSLYEGFGLPPLEAMACGTPVIVSNASSLPEVVGDAGIQIPPEDEQSLADALAEVAHNDSLREDLRHRGLAQAARFTWERTAQITAGVYRQVLAGTT